VVAGSSEAGTTSTGTYEAVGMKDGVFVASGSSFVVFLTPLLNSSLFSLLSDNVLVDMLIDTSVTIEPLTVDTCNEALATLSVRMPLEGVSIGDESVGVTGVTGVTGVDGASDVICTSVPSVTRQYFL
jgi:hypothetical protein